MDTVLPRPRLRLLAGLLFLLIASTGALATANPGSAALAGSLQSEMGCPGDWDPACPDSELLLDAEDDVWQATYALPAGSYEYKVALNDSWDENYGLNGQPNGANIPLTADGNVKFYYDHKTNWITDDVNSTIAVAAGSFQSELGCGGDWDPSCLRSWLQDVDGDGVYTFTASGLPAAGYEFKVALDEAWTTSFPGSNVPFTVNDPADVVTISFDSATTDVTVDVAGAPPPGPGYSVALVGDLQSELGCGGDWDPACAATELGFDAEDDVWQAVFTPPAGSYEYKVALNDSWAENYGAGGAPDGANIALAADGSPIKFYYDHKSHWITDNVNSTIAVAPGSFQNELGCGGDWDPSCLRSWLQDADGDGIYTFTTTALPAGSYESKVAINESWDENYGEGGVPNGANIFFTVANDGDAVTFSFDDSTKILTISAGPAPEAGPAYAIIHYYRSDGDYGDHTSGDYNDYWGLHLWGDGIDPSEVTDWTSPKPFLGEDEYGRFAWVKLTDASQPLNFIIHRGDVKDGTDADRSYIPANNPEVWLQQDDGANYNSQAAAQGYVTIRYHRPDGDYGDPTSSDFNDFWGLHLWGDAIDPAEGTEWTAPKKPTGFDDFGAFWNINIVDPTQPVNFIIHRGDAKDPGPDQSFLPTDSATIWQQSGDATIYESRGASEGFATIHYHRPAGDYGDYSSGNFADFWGLHVWDGAVSPTDWPSPLKPAGFDTFGPYFQVPLVDGAVELAYIIHRGDEKDPGPDQFLELNRFGYEVWQLQNADLADPYILPIPGPNVGNLNQERAYWLEEGTIAWETAGQAGVSYYLAYAPDGGLEATNSGIAGGTLIELEAGSISAAAQEKFPHLAGLPALQIPADSLALVPEILRGQFAVSAIGPDGLPVDATGLQIPGVLDDLYTYDGDLGITWDGDVPTIRVWAPTAKSVTFHLFADSAPATTSTTFPMTRDDASGVWSVSGDAGWKNQFYLFEVVVYAPTTRQVETNLVTDPYSLSLSTNSLRSQIVDLSDPALMPDSWSTMVKPPLAAPEDIAIYELHVRDFSIQDQTVPEMYRGTYMAFTVDDSNGMQHLQALADAGLSHVHLLPVFDIATVEEDRAAQVNPSFDELAGYPPDSAEQQAIIAQFGSLDGFNWGYDPYHFTAPEGSYSTNPDGSTRVVEFREMVLGLNHTGLRVVMDVVYNHTASSGQNDKSVLDRVVPGYYHRLNNKGDIERSSCCENTASEHNMMEKLMIDSLVTWAVAYKVDAFRFDLMGHHMLRNMIAVREALDALTMEEHGVDGSAIYIYGEGWNFGEVANNARGVNAVQANVAGTGIGSFNDRLRDAVRGGGCCPDREGLFVQGFGNGLYSDPNAYEFRSEGDQLAELLLFSDQIRVSMAGNLADYLLIDRNGNLVSGSQVDYFGLGAGYTEDPQEDITYVSKHDNQTLYDINVYGLPADTPMEERIRAQTLSLSTVFYGQGIPFFHAGVDMLRSKSLDRDSYNSGDWFNHLDFTYTDNNFGIGLPVAEKNENNWDLMQPYLADPALVADYDDVTLMNALFQEMLAVRSSSELFRLETLAEVQDRVVFHNVGPAQLPGLIVMTISDKTGADIDPLYDTLVVVINANDEPYLFSDADLVGLDLALHPVLADSVDPLVRDTAFDPTSGSVTIAGRTAAVLVELEPLAVESFTLIDADTDQPIPGYETLADGAVLDLSALPTQNLNVRANVAGAVGAVFFDLAPGRNRLENQAPYALAGDTPAGDYHGWTPAPGSYALTATPYPGPGVGGPAGFSLTINFTVVAGPPPVVESFTLIDAATDQPVPGFETLADGAVISLADLPPLLNVRANVSGAVDSVAFLLNESYGRTENSAPFALFGDVGGDYLGQPLAPGVYTLTATPYSGPGHSGDAGTPLTITVTIVD